VIGTSLVAASIGLALLALLYCCGTNYHYYRYFAGMGRRSLYFFPVTTTSPDPPVAAVVPFPVRLSVPEPVIVVGYPKSGTTSVWNYFNCSNVVAQHFCSGNSLATHPPCGPGRQNMATCLLTNMARIRRNRTNDKNLFRGCGRYQVYAQIDGERPVIKNARKTGSLNEDGRFDERYRLRHFLPQHFYLPELHESAPNATYLLPLRPPSDWAKSVQSWFRMKIYLYTEYKSFGDNNAENNNASSLSSGAVGEYPRRYRKMQRWLERVYREHAQYVRDFVRQHPSHKLIEVDIADPDAGRVMSESFGLPESCWGHHNKFEEHDKLVVDATK